MELSESIKLRFPEGLEDTFHDNPIYDENDEVIGFENINSNEINTLFAPRIPLTNIAGVECLRFKFEDLKGFEALSPNFNYNRDNAIKDIFDQMVGDLIIDQHWVRSLRRYVMGFVSRNNDHVEFFGSPYMGTHRIVFKTSDRTDWFRDIIDIDDVLLKDELIKCKWVNKDYHVSSDPFNLSIVYLMYRVQQSFLSKAQKEEALINLVMMYHYRALTSIMNHYYVYLVRKAVAETAYNKLSLKFDIKRYGSWTALFKARAEFIINPKTGIHYNTFTNMDDDKKIIYMVNDMESRLKGVINDYTKVLYAIKDNVDLVQTDDGKVLLDGKLVIKDIQKSINKKHTYIQTLLTNQGSFYNETLAEYAIKGMDRTPSDKFKQLLKDFPYQYNHPKGEKYREFVNDVITHLSEYLSYNNIKDSDVRNVVLKMKGAYTSNKSTNPLLFKLRDDGDSLVKDMTGIRTRSTVSSIRTSLMLYIVIRVITMEYFK